MPTEDFDRFLRRLEIDVDFSCREEHGERAMCGLRQNLPAVSFPDDGSGVVQGDVFYRGFNHTRSLN